MTDKDQQFLNRLNAYANEVLHDIEPQKTPVAAQLARLRPMMEEIAREEGANLEDVFIRYMDLASEDAVAREKAFQEGLVCDN